MDFARLTVKRRLERLARATSIADKLWQMQQMRLAQRERELNNLRAAERAAFDALEYLDPAFALRQIERLASRRREVEIAYADALAHAQESGRRLKLTERLRAEAASLSQREEAAASLRQSLQQRHVSVP